jgi:hypothetical protein
VTIELMLRAERKVLNFANALGLIALPNTAEFAAPPNQVVGDDDLSQLFASHEGRWIHRWVHYFPIYNEHLARFRGQPVKFIEIGISQGGSLQLWRKYLGPNAMIYGIDVDLRCKAFEEAPSNIRIGSQDDPGFLRSVVAEMGGVDVVIDDGSHHASHQKVSFDTLFPLLSDRGMYFIEDIHTSYWRHYGGGYGRKRSCIEQMKKLVDDIHWWHHKRRQHFANAHRTIRAIHFYESLVAIDKQTIPPPRDIARGVPSF